jgi:outer membrane PBP1 activator LpoA protein
MPGKQDRMPGIAWLAGVLVCLLLAACATKNTSTRAPPNNGRSEKQAQSEGARKTKPPSQRKKLVAQARTAAGQSNWAGAIAARVHLGRVLNRWDRRAENQKKLWHALQRLPLNVVAQPPAGRTLKGWYALAWLVRSDSVLAPRQMRRDLKLWQSTYPHHPAN